MYLDLFLDTFERSHHHLYNSVTFILLTQSTKKQNKKWVKNKVSKIVEGGGAGDRYLFLDLLRTGHHQLTGGWLRGGGQGGWMDGPSAITSVLSKK